MASLEPVGIGIYTQGLGAMPAPKQAAKLAKDNGISFVAMYAVQQDRFKGQIRTTIINKPDAIRRYAEAFATEGINPWIWGYPWAGCEDEFVERMGEALKASGNTVGVILDPELGYKWKGQQVAGQKEADPNASPPTGTEAERRASAAKLVNGVLDLLTEKHDLGVTSYGMSDYHRNFPWREFQAGWGSPQLYDVMPDQVDHGIAAWRAMGWTHVVPSVPAFGPKSEQNLDDFLECFVDGGEGIAGMIVWSWPSISRAEWRVLARWAERFKTLYHIL